MDNSDFADVLDWIAIRIALDECHDSALTAHSLSDRMAITIADHNANIELQLVALQLPDDAADILGRTGSWTFTWTGRVSGSHPLLTRDALKAIVALGQAAGAMVDIHQFDDDVDGFYESPLMAIESAMLRGPTSKQW